MKNANQIQFSINQHEYRCNIIYISRQPWIRRLLTSQCKGAKSEKLMSRKKQNQRCLWQKINKIKMNKKIKVTMLVAAVALAGLGTWKAYDYSEGNKQTLLANNLDAQASIIDDFTEFWNSKDWNCVDVTCYPGNYTLEAPKWVGNGQGSEAHWWKCTTCPSILIGGPY